MSSASFNVVSTVASDVSAGTPAAFSCVFTNEWTSSRHPVQYPSDAHWSPPVLAAHNNNYRMWAPGMVSSNGVERVAELGNSLSLFQEIADAAGTGDHLRGVITYNSDVQEQTLEDITLTPGTPLLSTITMIAPSPDWFTGFHDFSAIDSTTGTWYGEFTIETFPFDAGTEMGETFSLGNVAEDPRRPIQQFTPETVPSNGIFLNVENPDEADDSIEVLPVASWKCVLRETEKPENECTPSRQFCSESSECCSGICQLNTCRNTQTAPPKTGVSLGGQSGQGGAGGGVGSDRSDRLSPLDLRASDCKPSLQACSEASECCSGSCHLGFCRSTQSTISKTGSNLGAQAGLGGLGGTTTTVDHSEGLVRVERLEKCTPSLHVCSAASECCSGTCHLDVCGNKDSTTLGSNVGAQAGLGESGSTTVDRNEGLVKVEPLDKCSPSYQTCSASSECCSGECHLGFCLNTESTTPKTGLNFGSQARLDGSGGTTNTAERNNGLVRVERRDRCTPSLHACSAASDCCSGSCDLGVCRNTESVSLESGANSGSQAGLGGSGGGVAESAQTDDHTRRLRRRVRGSHN